MKDVNALVFFDMDGTLLSNDSVVVPEVKDALKKLIQRNIIPVIATGRATFEVAQLMSETGIDSIVSMNGQFIQFQGMVIQDQTIPQSISEKVLKYARSRNDVVGFYNVNEIAVSEDTKAAKAFYKGIHAEFPPVNANFYEEHEVNQLVIIANSADNEYQKQIPELTFTVTGEHSIDVFSAGNSKGEGIKKMLQATNLSGTKTYAFGDGMNDMPMFKSVDCGIAMGNAIDELKEIASMVTDTNENLGIVKGLQSVGLI